MDFKMQFKALKMGWALLVTLTNSADITISIGVSPLLDWLRAACVRFGPTATKRTQSLVDQTFEPTALDARVVAWEDKQSGPILEASYPSPSKNDTITTCSDEKEYSAVETSKI
jgi:hypothetical protein